jgi:hypothetical protein
MDKNLARNDIGLPYQVASIKYYLQCAGFSGSVKWKIGLVDGGPKKHANLWWGDSA